MKKAVAAVASIRQAMATTIIKIWSIAGPRSGHCATGFGVEGR
ncbi:MAG TPA: hypothetical protein QF572_09095 [Vicinamibacterales bacterium]|jgi:hypothetical protein|nr:hypothetical protein [Vicinamibacterales bacterium]HJN44316.1 hypothetical protein [Vicinamibacterales bacterium]